MWCISLNAFAPWNWKVLSRFNGVFVKVFINFGASSLLSRGGSKITTWTNILSKSDPPRHSNKAWHFRGDFYAEIFPAGFECAFKKHNLVPTWAVHQLPTFIDLTNYTFNGVSFLVPLIGGRWYIITQLAIYTTHIPLIYIYIANWVIICYLPPIKGTRKLHWYIWRTIQNVTLKTFHPSEYTEGSAGCKSRIVQCCHPLSNDKTPLDLKTGQKIRQS